MRLIFGEDYVPGAIPGKSETALDAPVVFVGYGIVAPQYKRNDYAGVDVKGKIVAYLGGAPSSYQSEERAHFATPGTKAILAEARGAVGAILIQRGAGRGGQGWDQVRTTWARRDGTGDVPGAPQLATLDDRGAAKLFEGSKTSWATIVKRTATGDASIKAEQLPGSLTVALRTTSQPGASSNVGRHHPAAAIPNSGRRSSSCLPISIISGSARRSMATRSTMARKTMPSASPR